MIYLIDPTAAVEKVCPGKCVDKCGPRFYPLYGVPV
jgi:hypothetical protein